MPHLVLECTANVLEKKKLAELLQECHVFLAKTLPADIASCKSRWIERKDFYIGEGEPNNAFVHVDLKVLPGRTPQKLQETGSGMMKILENYFSESKKKLNLQISLELNEMPVTYFKIA